ncbi:hypothetical protein PsorP6_006699 [Peronosclerospora sorghi]|uniref:Uncharacterized protein n=1 Tax=Peronosclerospora sorghi TaxID=230839 RepID=A0ACC0W2I3_9STRA|nr:hypothetical protein PsorP6_006699 [Peronosclerospora sorghi]
MPSFCRERADEAVPRASNKSTATTSPPLPSPPSTKRVDSASDLRRHVGRLVVETQQTIDSHLPLFRVALFLTVAASLAVSVKASGLLQRVKNVEDIPLWQFARRKKLRVRLVRQSRPDPSIFYVYHTPFLRRTGRRDVLPKSGLNGLDEKEENEEKDLLAIRLFGVRVHKIAEEWIWATFVSSSRYMTIQLLQRIHVEATGSVATCHVALRRLPFGRDFARELVSLGYAECIPEKLETYDTGSLTATSSLGRRLRKLEAAQRHAQIMQYGIWKEWQDTNISDRVLAAGRRATRKGFQRLIRKLGG